jgi:hypothetical protein
VTAVAGFREAAGVAGSADREALLRALDLALQAATAQVYAVLMDMTLHGGDLAMSPAEVSALREWTERVVWEVGGLRRAIRRAAVRLDRGPAGKGGGPSGG